HQSRNPFQTAKDFRVSSTEQPGRNQNYGPVCSLECGSLLPPLFVWSCFGSGKAQASLRTPKRTPRECWKNPCQVAKDFRLHSIGDTKPRSFTPARRGGSLSSSLW